MLDINYIRENPEKVKKGISAKGCDIKLVDQTLMADKQYRELLQEVEELRAQRNQAAKNKDIEKGKLIKAQLGKKEEALAIIEQEFNNLLTSLPNLPAEGVPEGDESKNEVLRTVGEPKKLNFKVRDHVELGEMLDIIDIERAAKVSGSRFGYLKNEGVMLELALVNFAMETLVKEGFSPVIPPALIKKEITEGLGYWQGGGNENYYLVMDLEENEQGLYLVGTGEHAVVPMLQGETLEARELPKKYAAFSPCFRREAGSYGKDTKGILRVHQFDKVEMVAFVKPDDDEVERRKLLAISEGFMQALGLPYQVVKLASGDLSIPAAETIDIETWIPSQDKYRETHSISTTGDFQARRLNIKYLPAGADKPAQAGTNANEKKYVHILNGTALAIGRTIIAILENYQQEDGSVKIPQVLQKYTGFAEIRPRK
ncbi:serine--tRNA ligase [Candidatus Microgenomates bacterium]|nr:serine--tRNA ligase [Candidatus Microgenomates bacterium]